MFSFICPSKKTTAWLFHCPLRNKQQSSTLAFRSATRLVYITTRPNPTKKHSYRVHRYLTACSRVAITVTNLHRARLLAPFTQTNPDGNAVSWPCSPRPIQMRMHVYSCECAHTGLLQQRCIHYVQIKIIRAERLAWKYTMVETPRQTERERERERGKRETTTYSERLTQIGMF